jgi:histidinol-phosphate aminotransferase
MNEEILALVRPAVTKLAGYQSARNTGKQHEIRIFMDANENPFPPYPATENEIGFNRYPEVQPLALRQVFGERNGVGPDGVFLSRGADEAIDLLTRIFCNEGTDGVILCSPTFPMYQHSVDLQGARLVDVPMTSDFQLDVPAILETHASDGHIKMMMVASPNNPTANLLRREDLVSLARAFAGASMLLVDELYLDYSGAESLAGIIDELPNVVVLRSLSKEHSMAGERIGITIAHPTVIELLNRVAAPYLLAQSAIRSAKAVASPEGSAHSAANIARILSERDRMSKELAELPLVQHVYPSDANFLLVKVTDGPVVSDRLTEFGIKVRDRSAVPGLANCVRISVGTPEENDELFSALRKIGES